MLDFLTPAPMQMVCLDDDSLSFRDGDDGVQFNPESLSLNRSLSVQGTSRAESPYGGFDMGEGSNDELEFTLTFDAAENTDTDLAETIEKFYKLTIPVIEGPDDDPRHPVVAFQWGPNFTFQGVVVSLGMDMSMFDSVGRIVRATVKVKLSGIAWQKIVTKPKEFKEKKHPPKESKAPPGVIPEFDIKIDGKEVLTDKTLGGDLREVMLTESLDELDIVEVRFKWNKKVQEEIEKMAPHGKEFVAMLREEGGPGSWSKTREIKGDIVEVQFDRSAGGSEMNVTLRGLGRRFKLKLNYESKTYEAKKQSDVVSAVSKNSGSSADAENTSGSAQDYVRANESDAEYLGRIVDENPAFVLRYEEGKKLRFVRAKSAGDGASVEMDWNALDEFKMRHSLEGVLNSVTAIGYDPIKHKWVEGKAAAKDLEKISGGKTAADLVQKFGGKLTLDNLSTAQQTQCESRAKAELQRAANKFVTGSVTGDFSPKARCGGDLTISGDNCPWPVDKTKLRITSVTHVFKVGLAPRSTMTFYSDSLPK